MSQNWKQRERDIAAYLSSHPSLEGWGKVVRAASISGGLNRGEDLLREDGTRLPVSIEIKHGYGSRPSMQLVADWLEQSHRQSHGLPYVVVHAPKHVQVRNCLVYSPWDHGSPATGWWSTPLAFWVQQEVWWSRGLEF